MGFFIFDQSTNEVIYSNAAHLPLIVYRVKSGRMEKIDTEGLPLGIEKSTRYAQKRFKLQKGDLLAFFTDGIVEAMNSQGEQYSLESVVKVIEEHHTLASQELLENLKADMDEFVGNNKQHDDQTMVLMKMN